MDFRARAAIQFMIFQWWKHVVLMTLWTLEQERLYSLWYFSDVNMFSSWLYGLESKGGFTVYDISVVETCWPHDFSDLRARAPIQFMIFQLWKHVVLMTLWTWEQGRLYSLWYLSGGNMLSSWLYGLESKGGYTVYVIWVVETCCSHDFMDLRARAAIQFMLFEWWKHVVRMTLWTWEQGRLYSLCYLSGGYMLSSWLHWL